jgi:hypothetical protein
MTGFAVEIGQHLTSLAVDADGDRRHLESGISQILQECVDSRSMGLRDAGQCRLCERPHCRNCRRKGASLGFLNRSRRQCMATIGSRSSTSIAMCRMTNGSPHHPSHPL